MIPVLSHDLEPDDSTKTDQQRISALLPSHTTVLCHLYFRLTVLRTAVQHWTTMPSPWQLARRETERVAEVALQWPGSNLNCAARATNRGTDQFVPLLNPLQRRPTLLPSSSVERSQ